MHRIKRTHSIDDVQSTNDLLTGRAGINLFVRYLSGIDLFPHIERMFGSMRKNGKGVPIVELFKQVLCFLFDGTSRHLSWFDVLTKGPSYAAIIETAPERMASSHAVKRFSQAFSLPRIFLFRRLLLQLFLWRLRVAPPKLIELNIHSYHQRGADELVHRAFKDFAFEELPFLRFPPNAAFYSMMLLGFFPVHPYMPRIWPRPGVKVFLME